jgi:hypothetical protein
MRIGARVTEKWGGYSEAYYHDTSASGQPDYIYCITYGAPYRAVGVEVEYGPLWVFRGRMDIAELQFFDHETGDPSALGGRAFSIFPTLGADIFIEPPVRWRALPYVWGGCQVTAYGGRPDIPDPRFIYGPEVHIRAGIGVRYSLTRRFDAFGEIQGYAHDTFRNLMPDDLMSAGGQGFYGSIGLCRAQLGVRMAVGKLCAD